MGARSAIAPLLNGVFDFSIACCGENRDAKNHRDARTDFVTHRRFFLFFLWGGFSRMLVELTCYANR